ncbi:alpha/beta fold hydrolase [Streptomyces millisiae]|uniref:Alpha/beta fold hydrolase n=1 Tax=Streptomyces millisiae TaxID=3075542 RepID=A0ABU2LXX5_9ACTN|nr:alpha/beta fold hydrolase [Streptomyces sp. DSM 44918]MDT0322442.1 alpha/beta fold hydrolase [Streptomyces sp. DSM 44918]
MPAEAEGAFRPHVVDTGPPAGGQGPPLLLVHGWGGDGEDWAPLLPSLTPHHRVLVPDLPGHGRSPAALARCSPRAAATDLATWLRASGVGPVVAVGHSLGGQVVTALAVEHPELVRSLVAVAAAYGGDAAEAGRLPAEQAALRREGTAWAVGFVRRAFTADSPPGPRERHERLMAAMDPEVLLRYREAMYLAPDAFGLRPATEAYLRRRRCPVLAVHDSPAAAAWERTTLPDARSRVVRWEGVGHYLHEERPAELAALVRDWSRVG